MLQRAQPAEREELPIGRPAPAESAPVEGLSPPPIAPGATTRLVRPMLFAAAAGALGVFGWYLSVILTDFKLGVVAIGIGWLVGAAAVRGARGRGGIDLALGSVALALASIFLGEYLIVSRAVASAGDGSGILAFGAFAARYPGTVDLLDLVFYALGAWQAWSVPAAAGRS